MNTRFDYTDEWDGLLKRAGIYGYSETGQNRTQHEERIIYRIYHPHGAIKQCGDYEITDHNSQQKTQGQKRKEERKSIFSSFF